MFRIGTISLYAIALSSALFLASCGGKITKAQKKLEAQGIPLEASQVVKAIENNDHETLHHLLLCGVHPHQCRNDGLTPLQIASQRNDHRAIHLLLRHDADPNAVAPKTPSPLELAVHHADIPLAKALISKGANVNRRTSDGSRLLPWCINHGRYIIAEALLQAGADPHGTDNQGSTALACSVEKNLPNLATLLLEKGADPGKLSPENPLLIRAIQHNWNDLIPLLIQRGADINAPAPDGRTAAEFALDTGKKSTFLALLKLGAKPSTGTWENLLWQALQNKNHSRLQTLLDAGIKPTTTNSQGYTLPHAAVLANDIPALTILLAHSTPPGAAYHAACLTANLPAIILLEKHNIRPTTDHPPHFDAPLHCAIRSGNADVIGHLLQHPQDLHTLGTENQTPLTCAIARRQPAIVKLLLEKGADPNRKLEPKAHESFLVIIPGNGMKWYLKNDRNITPLMLAADTGNIEIVQTLLHHKASKNTWTAINKTWPLNFASRRSDVPMMRLLLGQDPHNETQKIIVNLTKQTATILNTAGKTIFTTRISSGKKGNATPTGIYAITNKYRLWHSTIYDGAPMPCFQRFSCGDFGFHQGICPGYPASHGCIRVPAGNAQKLYSLTKLGDRVIIEK